MGIHHVEAVVRPGSQRSLPDYQLQRLGAHPPSEAFFKGVVEPTSLHPFQKLVAHPIGLDYQRVEGVGDPVGADYKLQVGVSAGEGL